jgi:hypothetical protein
MGRQLGPPQGPDHIAGDFWVFPLPKQGLKTNRKALVVAHFPWAWTPSTEMRLRMVFSILESFPSLQQDSSLVFLPFFYDYRMVSWS